MEHHAEIYEQITNANSANQGSQLVPDHLVQETIVENDGQVSSMTCELSDGIGIVLPNSSINMSNNTETLKFEKICENDTNLTFHTQSDKEQNIEIPQNQTSHQEEDNSTVIALKLQTDNSESINEVIIDSNESVPVINVNDSIPSLSNNQTSNDHNVLSNDLIVIDTLSATDEHTEKYDQVKQNITSEKEINCVTDNIELEKNEPIEMENLPIEPEVVNESVNIAMEEEITVENNCANDLKEQHEDSNNEELNSDVTEKMECSVLPDESAKETNVVINSDDVAVLTEFSSVEYNVQAENSKMGDIKTENDDKLKESIKEEIIKNKEELMENILSIDNNKQKDKQNDASTYDELLNGDDDDDDVDEAKLILQLSAQSTENHSKVIQDIFDDWQDENGEEEVNQSSNSFKDNHDSVELELQNLLNDGAQQEETVSSINIDPTEKSVSDNSKSGKTKIFKPETLSPSKPAVEAKTSTPNNKSSNSSSIKDLTVGHSPRNLSQDQILDSKQKQHSPRPGVKVPGSHLTSQIASSAEVHEALKERLREKQKDLVTPKTADIVFVKKITQRLSNQLSGAVSVPPLIPLQIAPTNESQKNKDNKSEISEDEKSNKVSSSTTADKELLAILEGDVDPDWSNLKSVTEESNKLSNSADSHSTGSKLDPAVERELALKQLLELPNIPTKKTNPVVPKKTKKSGKPTKTLNNTLESKSSDEMKTEIISLDSAEEESPKKDKTPKALKENNNQNMCSTATSAAIVDLSVEESRSGRKRKLTEKAREHELNVKRQKVPKVKSGTEKKSLQELPENSKQKTDLDSPAISKSKSTSDAAMELNSPSTPKSGQSKMDVKQNKPEIKQNKVDVKGSASKSEIKQTGTKVTSTKGKMTLVKRTKIGLLKKDVPISKKKFAVKNLLRQKMADKKSAILKTKTQGASTPKTLSEKSLTTGGLVTKTKKVVTEIDRLLQDEGVVNLLYDVEQPDLRKRLVPITKSQKKVMDVEKAERELKLRTKLVRNAVLRLRNSSTSTVKISPRSRRNVSTTEQLSPQSEKKSNESAKPPKSPASATAASDFIIPAKIRNAADASRIIRRHSSSSFSSASASPRVSVDMPPESIKLDEADMSTKSKRKLSHDLIDKPDTRKNKKKLTSKEETEDKDTTEKSPIKKEATKKITTRSNVASVSPAVSVKTGLKNKKVPKNKSPSESSVNDAKSSKIQDELSACLAEAATALLSSINTTGSSRLSNVSTSRKKGSSNISRADDEKVDSKKLFSNKEINVRQHGHLVQLILTPSTPVSGIRNAITIQVMNEMRDALSILKNDNDCRVVLFTSTGTSFCEGLEVSTLLQSNKDERKIRAEETATAVKDFIKELAAFSKPIVAGVQGAAIGLGVTMLPLFDLVIASDKATFSTPYGKLGQIPEGAAVLTLSHSLGSAFTNELLLGGRVLTASEALRAGLVTRVLWPDRFQGELLPSLKAMSEQSAQSMEATKALLRQSRRQKLETALETESLLLIKHWCSLECQEAIKSYIEEKGQ